MDLIRMRLESMSNGSVTTAWDLVVYRVADRFVVGETIKLSGERMEIEAATLAIYNATLLKH